MGQPLLSHCMHDVAERRQFDRMEVRCRARIRIGTRHYTGYIENISEAGAKLMTFTPIRYSGEVLLRLRDLPPLRGELRWSDMLKAGMSFHLNFAEEQLIEWAAGRLPMNSRSKRRCEVLPAACSAAALIIER